MMSGWIAAMHQAGGASAVWVAGIFRTEMDNYTVAFLLAGVICLVAAGLVLFIGEQHKDARLVASGDF